MTEGAPGSAGKHRDPPNLIPPSFLTCHPSLHPFDTCTLAHVKGQYRVSNLTVAPARTPAPILPPSFAHVWHEHARRAMVSALSSVRPLALPRSIQRSWVRRRCRVGPGWRWAEGLYHQWEGLQPPLCCCCCCCCRYCCRCHRDRTDHRRAEYCPGRGERGRGGERGRLHHIVRDVDEEQRRGLAAPARAPLVLTPLLFPTVSFITISTPSAWTDSVEIVSGDSCSSSIGACTACIRGQA